jgi:hypothetical protein
VPLVYALQKRMHAVAEHLVLHGADPRVPPMMDGDLTPKAVQQRLLELGVASVATMLAMRPSPQALKSTPRDLAVRCFAPHLRRSVPKCRGEPFPIYRRARACHLCKYFSCEKCVIPSGNGTQVGALAFRQPSSLSLPTPPPFLSLSRREPRSAGPVGARESPPPIESGKDTRGWQDGSAALILCPAFGVGWGGGPVGWDCGRTRCVKCASSLC